VKGPWTVGSQAEFAASFARTNYRFKYFELVLESGGDPIDVEFNYKDLAHLKVVHNTFDIFYSHIGDDVQSCVVMQKLFGLNFPLTHMALQLGKNHLFFHDSFLNILLTSEVITEALPDHRVRVKTIYGIGAPNLLLPLIFPILKRLLTRNYHILMEGDAPMRNRRGELRRWGVRLPKTSYSFPETLDIRPQHAFSSDKVEVPEPVSIVVSSVPTDVPLLIGRSDHYGVQIIRRVDAIDIFPRMCPHEGACLDQKTFKGQGAISCGWHGRRIGPVLRIALPAQPAEYLGPFHRFVVSGDELRILPIPTDDRTAKADWTTSAVVAPRVGS
jgi:nitrite reductase/ring-hydroxylating ferredoxin subunit